jgi:hypothetical protein
MYGAGFTKHNTNAGFVDEELHRVTPQVRLGQSQLLGWHASIVVFGMY